MNVIIVSDTHMPRMAKQLPKTLTEEMKSDGSYHSSGDWQTKHVYEELKPYAPVTGVYGNVDEAFFISNLDENLSLNLESHRIGITHGAW